MADMRALNVERSCALVASVFSEGRRQSVRLLSGVHRSFGLNPNRTIINVPFPALAANWTLRTLTCGIALQCSPSKDRIAQYRLHELSPRQLQALTLVEGEVALGWVASRWPGLLPEFQRLLPNFVIANSELDASNMLDKAQALARSDRELFCHPLLGHLSLTASSQDGLIASLRRMYGQMPWSSKRPLSRALHTIPVGGQGGVQNPNLPPPSRPDHDDVEIRADRRVGIPYPEWNIWKQKFLTDHVAVLENKYSRLAQPPKPIAADLRRWFEQHTHRGMKNHLEDGTDLDIDRYINFYIDTVNKKTAAANGKATEARIFRDLLPIARDVTTAILLDGSSSLNVGHGRIFQLELNCADALCRAMALAGERHGLFVFSGNTRHRVDVTCLKDFNDTHCVVPSNLGLAAGGYTRLGAPIRHLTSRLLQQPSERRLLIVIGDGLMSDEGYEGKYAWADVAHAVEEANDAGVSIYYIGIGAIRVDPLPDIFGSKRSTRIRRVEELPRVLAHVHRELVAA